jgi:DNA-binding XRE family transcriptional regulator
MDPFLDKLGYALRKIRLERGLPQDHIEPMISRTTLSKWESGNTAPNISYLKAVCEAYGISLQYLFDQIEFHHPMINLPTGTGKKSTSPPNQGTFSRRTFFCRDEYYNQLRKISSESRKSIKDLMDDLLKKYLDQSR